MKHPWHSRVACYRSINADWFEICGEIEIIFVHETLNDLTVQSLKERSPMIFTLEQKLLACPFMKLDDLGISSNCVETWNEQKLTTLESTLNTELNNVYLDFYAALDTYESKCMQHETVFCRTMCLPRFLHKNDIKHYQEIRKNIVRKQIEDWRIVEHKSNQIYCYKANCMMCNHTLESVDGAAPAADGKLSHISNVSSRT